MSQNITLMGASYSDVPAVELPITGGGIASFFDVSDTTAAASDVASGKYFYASDGTKTQGTASGGGGGSTNFARGSFTVGSSNTTSMGTIDTGVDFLYFLVFTDSGVSGQSVKAFKGACVKFNNGDGVYSSLWMMSTNNAGSSYSAYTSSGNSTYPKKAGTKFTWSSMGTSGTAPGYLLANKTYKWVAWKEA